VGRGRPGRAAVPDVATLSAVQQVDPGLPDAVNQRQVAVLRSMAHELGVQADMTPEAAFALSTSVWLRGLLEWVANHSGVDEAVIRGFLRDISAHSIEDYLAHPQVATIIADTPEART